MTVNLYMGLYTIGRQAVRRRRRSVTANKSEPGGGLGQDGRPEEVCRRQQLPVRGSEPRGTAETVFDRGLFREVVLQGFRTTFPNCARFSINSCACRASVSGSTRSTTPRIFPALTNSIASSNSAFEPINEPSMFKCR